MPDEIVESSDALDKQLFNEAVSPTPAEPAAAPVVEAVEPAKPRDEKGRFAPVEAKSEPAEPPKVETPVQPEPEDRQGIPAWRLREEAEAKRELARQLEAEKADRARERAELQALQQRLSTLEKPKVQEQLPDPLVDPDGYRAHFDKQLNDRLLNQQREFDMRLAHRQHGDIFEKAYAEAQQAIRQGDSQLSALMNNTDSPGETLVSWYKQRQTMREVGNDPNVWLEKKLEERLNDPAFLAKAMERARTKAAATPSARPAVNLPPSLSAASSAGAQVSDPDDGDNSDAALFNQYMRRR